MLTFNCNNATAGASPAYFVATPTVPALPIVVDSPHSGIAYPPDFATVAPDDAIRTTWDAYVDEPVGRHAARGGTLLGARFPRAYIDPNRAETDIDATLLAEPWPEPLAPQPYTQRGMGLIRRDALPGVPLYDRKLSLEAVRHRIDAYYLPYRRALAGIAEPARARRAVAYRLPFDEVARQRDERRRGRMAAGRRRQRPARHDRGPGLHRVDRAVVRRRRLSRADQRPVPGAATC